MTAGMEAYNEGGQLQVSTDLLNYYLHSKGTYTLATDMWQNTTTGHRKGNIYGSSTYTDLEFLYTDSTNAFSVVGDIVAVACTTHPIAIQTSFVFDPGDGLGPVTYWKIYTNTTGATPTVYTFNRTNRLAIDDHGAGLEVYTSSGKLAYTSKYPSLRHVSLHNVGAPSTTETFVSLPTGPTYAFAIKSPSIAQMYGGGGVTPVLYEGNILTSAPPTITPRPNGRALAVRTASNGFYWRGINGGIYTNGNKTDGIIQIIDVTGL